MKFSLLQKQSLKIAFFGTAFLFFSTLAISHYLDNDLWILLALITVMFVALFLISWYFLHIFISKQVGRVYNSKLFENEPFLKNHLDDLDFELLIEKITRFAENKHLEIEQLRDRDDFRKDFLGDVSHELKTPLFSAQGYLYTILDPSFDDDLLEKKYLERTRKSVERLIYIVKDLDMIAKLESGMRLNQGSFNIVKTIKDVFDQLEIKSNRKNISLSLEGDNEYPIFVRADKERIEQVLTNLVSNSINYGSTNGFTKVKISAHSTYQLKIAIQDNGVGIAKEHIPRLFERFYRIDKSRSREQGGSGLGLAIVKHILEAHNQEVFVKSELGSGSVFSFTLNKAKA